jgi:hypothetical protein
MADLLQLPAIFYENRHILLNISIITAYMRFIKPGYVMCISNYQRSIKEPGSCKVIPLDQWQVINSWCL